MSDQAGASDDQAHQDPIHPPIQPGLTCDDPNGAPVYWDDLPGGRDVPRERPGDQAGAPGDQAGTSDTSDRQDVTRQYLAAYRSPVPDVHQLSQHRATLQFADGSMGVECQGMCGARCWTQEAMYRDEFEPVPFDVLVDSVMALIDPVEMALYAEFDERDMPSEARLIALEEARTMLSYAVYSLNHAAGEHGLY